MDDLVKCDLVWDELHHLVKAFRTPKMTVASRGFNDIVCSSCLGVTWLFYGLGFWNGFIAPIFRLLKMSVKLLPLLLKAM